MQNFSQLSRVCQSAQIPQGDLWAKQQHLAGHQYICVIDFALGFYAIEVKEESQPYLCIYTEGIGYHAYIWMPMGIADAPSVGITYEDNHERVDYISMHHFRARS